MTQPKIQNKSSAAIKSLLDNTKEVLQSLSNLNIDVTSWDLMTTYTGWSDLRCISAKG